MVPGKRVEGFISCRSEVPMASLAKACVALAVLAFILAVVGSFTGPIANIRPHTFSQAATNLALIALALFVGFKEEKASA